MNLDTLKIYCEVARLRSFSRAASEMRITQSAASQAVQSLEREIGKKLVDRSHRPAHLTPAGERFYKACRDLLERFEQSIADIQELDNEVAGPLHVASIYSVGLYHTDEIGKFMEKHPKVNVRLQYLRPNLVVNAVLQGEAALGLISYPRESRDLVVRPWLEEEMVLVCHPQHRLASKKFVKLTDVEGENFVAFDSDLAIRKQIDAALSRHKVNVKIAMEFDNIETMKQAIQIDSGIGILPAVTVRDGIEAGVLAVVKFRPSELTRPIGIIYRKSKPLSLAARKLIEMLCGQPVED